MDDRVIKIEALGLAHDIAKGLCVEFGANLEPLRQLCERLIRAERFIKALQMPAMADKPGEHSGA